MRRTAHSCGPVLVRRDTLIESTSLFCAPCNRAPGIPEEIFFRIIRPSEPALGIRVRRHRAARGRPGVVWDTACRIRPPATRQSCRDRHPLWGEARGCQPRLLCRASELCRFHPSSGRSQHLSARARSPIQPLTLPSASRPGLRCLRAWVQGPTPVAPQHQRESPLERRFLGRH